MDNTQGTLGVSTSTENGDNIYREVYMIDDNYIQVIYDLKYEKQKEIRKLLNEF